jgi:hypothetical protein
MKQPRQLQLARVLRRHVPALAWAVLEVCQLRQAALPLRVQSCICLARFRRLRVRRVRGSWHAFVRSHAVKRPWPRMCVCFRFQPLTCASWCTLRLGCVCWTTRGDAQGC